PIATVATGTPAGICTVARSASRPLSAEPPTGTPITGSTVCAATTPARCAAPPAPAISTPIPRRRAVCTYLMSAFGERCAERTLTSCSISKLRRRSAAGSSVSQSLSLPIRIPTCGFPSRPAMIPLPRSCQRPMPDVTPVVHAGPRDLCHGRIGVVDGPSDRLPERRHPEHPAAVRDDPLALPTGAGVEHHRVGEGRRPVEAADLRPLAHRAGISLGREHHAHGRPCFPAHVGIRERPVAGAHEQIYEVRAQPHQDRLALGIAEADVELEQLGAPVLHHE